MMVHLRRIGSVLAADKKKLCLMIGLVGVGMLLWGRLLLQQVPRSAVANQKVAQQAVEKSDKTADTRRPTVRIEPIRAVHRDFFRMEREQFTLLRPSVQIPHTEEKSSTDEADELHRRRAVMNAADGLKLQTTILGDMPKAMINGDIIGVGQTIRGFVLREVSSRYVTLEMNGVMVKLEM